jgi:PhnB protein
MTQSKLTTITPFLVVNNGKKAFDFYVAAFGATEVVKYDMPDGKLTAKISMDGATFWLGDEEPEFNNLSPDRIGGSAVRIILTVEDPDTVFAKALKAGATQICPMTTEEFWRIGKLADPFGHIWEIGKPLAGE